MQYSDITLSELSKKRVIDTDGVRVGKIKDVRFDEKGSTWFVLSGGFVEAVLERIHVRHKMDLLVPADWIGSVGEHEIVLTQSAFQLESTCEECWVREKERLIANATDPHDHQSLRLVGPPIV
jgi:sporulation protein YlmC with PRC-barrel domain